MEIGRSEEKRITALTGELYPKVNYLGKRGCGLNILRKSETGQTFQ